MSNLPTPITSWTASSVIKFLEKEHNTKFEELDEYLKQFNANEADQGFIGAWGCEMKEDDVEIPGLPELLSLMEVHNIDMITED